MTSKDTLPTEFPHTRLFPALDEETWIVVEVAPRDYSASAIARAVEDCDAHLINLNVLSDRSESEALRALLRVDHAEARTVARSLARYGIEAVEVPFGADRPSADHENPDDEGTPADPDDTQRRRALELLRILNV